MPNMNYGILDDTRNDTRNADFDENDTRNDTRNTDFSKNDTRNDTRNADFGKNDTRKKENKQLKRKIIRIMEMAPAITTTAIAFRLELSRSTVARKVKQLIDEDIVEHIGPTKKVIGK